MKRQQPQASDPIDLAAQALRHRDRSRSQIDERLARAGVEDDRRSDALDALERIGYVDDTRFAAQRAESLADREYGDEAIRVLLLAEGVTAEVAGEAVGALRPEVERAAEIVGRIGASPKTAARLARKGFGEDAVEAAAGGFATDGSEA
ncbi:MAG TPA: RecX family transcriptional regulator [Gaiellaceae bacterium]|nr:RecX family transcriptional regulator [Gaiellaceae bacterium]